MDTIKHIFSLFLFSGLILMSSCSTDFLNETLETDRGMEYYKSDEGILALAAGTYHQVLKTPFDGEWLYCATNYGVDEFNVGGDASNSV